MEKYIQSANTSMKSSSRFIEKPSFSSKFKPEIVEVLSNHYNFSIGATGKIYQWAAKYEPELELDSRQVKNEIFNLNAKEIRQKLGIYVRTGDIVYTFSNHFLEPLAGPFKCHPKYTLYIKNIQKTLELCNIDAPEETRIQIIKVINSGIKSVMRNLEFTEFGLSRKFYDMKKKQQFEQGDFILNVMGGFYTSIELYQDKIPKLMIDCSSRIIRDYSMWEEIEFFLERDLKKFKGKDSDLKAFEKDKLNQIIDKYVIGRNFLADYGNNKVYLIEGVDFAKSPLSQFEDQSKAKDYKTYFLKQYGMKIQNEKQFLVYAYRTEKRMEGDKLVKNQVKVWLVPELMKPTGLIDEIKNDRMGMQELAKLTRLIPKVRVQRHEQLIKLINELAGSESSGRLKNELGFKIDPNSNKISGILLRTPDIRLSKVISPDRTGNFIIKNGIFDKAFKLTKWLILCNSEHLKLAKKLSENLLEKEKNLGVTISEPTIVALKPESEGRPITADALKVELKKRYLEIKIALIFLPKFNTDKVYAQVKGFCNQELGLPTQFFSNWRPDKTKNIDNYTVGFKLLTEMSAKMGAKLWKVVTSEELKEKDIMIVGADVFHKMRLESVAAVVSTYDREFTSFYSQASVQKRSGDDLLHHMGEAVLKGCIQFAKENKAPPKNIIVFRDGVGISQIDSVREKEITFLVDGLKKAYESHEIRVAYIVVTKRIGDRFFVDNIDGIANPSGGLIIDSKVIRDNAFEFFMVPISVTNEGTANPVNYSVIFNNTDLKAEQFYELAFNSCYGYYNWYGAVRLPACLMMAHKLADQIGQSTYGKVAIFNETAEKIKKLPFYL